MRWIMAKLRHQVGDFDEAIKSCEEGFDISVKRNNGRHCPDFLHLNANVLHDNGTVNKEILYRLLIKAYSGYVALNRSGPAQLVLAQAKEQFETYLELYGMDLLMFPQALKAHYSRGKSVSRSGFNLLLNAFRVQSGFTRGELCSNLCGVSMLAKLEGCPNKVSSFYLIEALMQRMGRDVRLYRGYYVSAQVFDDITMRDKIQVLCRQGKYADAEVLLDKLALSKDYKKGAPLQYVRKTRATIYGSKNGNNVRYMEMLKEAMQIICPHFCEDNIRKYPLTLTEAVIINQMAIYYENTDDLTRAVKVYEDLLANIEANWRDETLKARLFATVSFNLSSCLSLLNKSKQAQAIIEKALEFEQCRDRLNMTSGLFFNSAYNLVVGGTNKSEGIPLLALSYYVDEIFIEHGSKNDLITTQNFTREHFGFCFV